MVRIRRRGRALKTWVEEINKDVRDCIGIENMIFDRVRVEKYNLESHLRWMGKWLVVNERRRVGIKLAYSPQKFSPSNMIMMFLFLFSILFKWCNRIMGIGI